MLVIEGEHIAMGRERAQGGEIVRRTNGDVAAHQRRRIVRRFREHGQRLAERDRRLLRHPRELAAADHADDRQLRASVHG